MRILIVGGGAREHALGLGLAGHELFFGPGNAGTASLGRNVDVRADDVPAVTRVAADLGVELVVAGPEAPLVAGLADALAARGIPCFGPTREAARLEGSKAYMKGVLGEAGVPTAAFRVFDDAAEARAYVRAAGRPLVVKADGLCAGKGVVVAKDEAEALEAIDRMMVRRELGEAGATVVIEETLGGEEASYHVVTDGERVVALAPAQDHKRVHDQDRGPNTGGMGAYAPAPIVDAAMEERVASRIIEPVLAVMRRRGAPFRGVLCAGLMLEDGEPRVLEFNLRFGDPETSVIVPLFDGDLAALLAGAARGDLSGARAGRRPGAALGVVMAAEGYPGRVTTGDVISGADGALPEDTCILHAGTGRDVEGRLVTTGGRVLVVRATAPTLVRARDAAYAAVAGVRFRGEHHRTDIGARALGPRA